MAESDESSDSEPQSKWETFKEIDGIEQSLLDVLRENDCWYLTDLQKLYLKDILKRRNVGIQARPESGKTTMLAVALAYGLRKGRDRTQAVLICETHERGKEIKERLERVTRCIPEFTIGLFTGNWKLRQNQRTLSLEGPPDVCVATPQRLLDLVSHEDTIPQMNLRHVKYFIIYDVLRIFSNPPQVAICQKIHSFLDPNRQENLQYLMISRSLEYNMKNAMRIYFQPTKGMPDWGIMSEQFVIKEEAKNITTMTLERRMRSATYQKYGVAHTLMRIPDQMLKLGLPALLMGGLRAHGIKFLTHHQFTVMSHVVGLARGRPRHTICQIKNRGVGKITMAVMAALTQIDNALQIPGGCQELLVLMLCHDAGRVNYVTNVFKTLGKEYISHDLLTVKPLYKGGAPLDERSRVQVCVSTPLALASSMRTSNTSVASVQFFVLADCDDIFARPEYHPILATMRHKISQQEDLRIMCLARDESVIGECERFIGVGVDQTFVYKQYMLEEFLDMLESSDEDDDEEEEVVDVPE